MANEGRFLNKRFRNLDGIIANNGAAVMEEGGAWSLIGGARIGDGATKVAKLISATTTVSLSVLNPIGSGNAGQDIALTGVVPGDLVMAQPVASVPLALMWSVSCYSAGVVHIHGLATSTTGAWDIAGTTWRVFAIQF